MTTESTNSSRLLLSFASLGIVFGDIGTSPLYAFHYLTMYSHEADIVLGAVSIIFWLINIVFVFKYLLITLSFTNNGEGGVIALYNSLIVHIKHNQSLEKFCFLLALFGSGLFFGDAVLTPAISVLSAVEGLQLISGVSAQQTLLIACLILTLLFGLQQKGTEKVSHYFSPIIACWFTLLFVSGLFYILKFPAVLKAINPLFALSFIQSNPGSIFFILSVAVLSITGAEALYADVGHFGKEPIRFAGLGIAYPALIANYFGQAAYLLMTPEQHTHSFYGMFGDHYFWLAFILATLASIVASQATISAIFSLTKQLIHMGLLPRLKIFNTNHQEYGQIYIPSINYVVFAGVIFSIVLFQSGTNLSHAYGVAVVFTMAITSIFLFLKFWHSKEEHGLAYLVVSAFFLMIDLLMAIPVSFKFLDGGWFTLLISMIFGYCMLIWKKGNELIFEQVHRNSMTLEDFSRGLDGKNYLLIPRTAIYIVKGTLKTPMALLANMKHNMVLHQKNILLTVDFLDIPWVPASHRVELEKLNDHFWHLKMVFGFMNRADVSGGLLLAQELGLEIQAGQLSFIVPRQTIISSLEDGMSPLSEKIYAWMAKNTDNLIEYYEIPEDEVIEIGSVITI